MRNLLREFGFEPLLADSGPAAVEAAAKCPPHFVLIDKNMPGMSGAEVIRALRDELELGDTPIFILSGEPVGQTEIAELRANGAVQKPFDVRALVDIIRTHVSAVRH